MKYQLVREEAIVDGNGDAIDWKFTVVAEGPTKEGLIKHARLRSLDKYTHAIEQIDPETNEETRLGMIIDLL